MADEENSLGKALKKYTWRRHDNYFPSVSYNRIVTRSQVAFHKLPNTRENLSLFADPTRHTAPGYPHLMEVMKGSSGSVPRTIITRSTSRFLKKSLELEQKLIPYKDQLGEPVEQDVKPVIDDVQRRQSSVQRASIPIPSEDVKQERLSVVGRRLFGVGEDEAVEGFDSGIAKEQRRSSSLERYLHQQSVIDRCLRQSSALSSIDGYLRQPSTDFERRTSEASGSDQLPSFDEKRKSSVAPEPAPQIEEQRRDSSDTERDFGQKIDETLSGFRQDSLSPTVQEIENIWNLILAASEGLSESMEIDEVHEEEAKRKSLLPRPASFSRDSDQDVQSAEDDSQVLESQGTEDEEAPQEEQPVRRRLRYRLPIVEDPYERWRGFPEMEEPPLERREFHPSEPTPEDGEGEM